MSNKLSISCGQIAPNARGHGEVIRQRDHLPIAEQHAIVASGAAYRGVAGDAEGRVCMGKHRTAALVCTTRDGYLIGDLAVLGDAGW